MLVSRIPSSGNTLFVNRKSNSLQTIECKACNQEGGKQKMKKFLVFVCAMGLVFGLVGVQQAESFKVSVDIEPGTCPNTLNVKADLLPVAILGTEDFDVTSIDPETIYLQGVVEPIRSNVEDVAEPVDGDPCKVCGDLKDGHADLTLKFDIQAIVGELVLGEVNDGDLEPLTLTGALLDGTPIWGTDCVVIMKKGKVDGPAPTGTITMDDPDATFVPDCTTPGSCDPLSEWADYSGLGHDGGLHYMAIKSETTGETIDGTATWTPTIPVTGLYKVYAKWHSNQWRSDSVTYTIYYNEGSVQVPADQTANGGQWNLLDTLKFNKGTSCYVELSNDAPGSTPSTDWVVADAIMFVYQQ